MASLVTEEWGKGEAASARKRRKCLPWGGLVRNDVPPPGEHVFTR